MDVFKPYFNAWLKSRLPQQNSIQLTQKRLFILPTMQGLAFLLLIAVLLLVAINYENNLVYALSFFLFSLLVTTLHFTFFNLHGLALSISNQPSGFAGSIIHFDILLSNIKKQAFHKVEIGFRNQPYESVDILKDQPTQVKLPLRAMERGWLQPEPIIVKTTFPLGLVKCWSVLYFANKAIVYPKPQFLTEWPGQASDSEKETQTQPKSGDDELIGFRGYVAGDSPKLIHWPSLAKNKTLSTKQYARFLQEDHFADWSSLEHETIEAKLSLLTGWICDLNKQNKRFGLKLPTKTYPIDQGNQYYHHLLKSLALYNKAE